MVYFPNLPCNLQEKGAYIPQWRAPRKVIMQQISNFSKSHQQICRKKEPIVRSGGFAPRDNVVKEQEGVCCVMVASRKDRYARPCRTLQETGVHRESDVRRSHRTPLPADTMHTSCCIIDADCRIQMREFALAWRLSPLSTPPHSPAQICSPRSSLCYWKPQDARISTSQRSALSA